jgi:outer membrane lipoprotein-sorting protein
MRKKNLLFFLFLGWFCFLSLQCFWQKKPPLHSKLELTGKELKKIENIRGEIIGKIWQKNGKKKKIRARFIICPAQNKMRLEILAPFSFVSSCLILQNDLLSVFCPSQRLLFKKKLHDDFTSEKILALFLGEADTKVLAGSSFTEEFSLHPYLPVLKKYKKENFEIQYLQFKEKKGVIYPGKIAIFLPEEGVRINLAYRRIRVNEKVKKDLFKIKYPSQVVVRENFNWRDLF